MSMQAVTRKLMRLKSQCGLIVDAKSLMLGPLSAYLKHSTIWEEVSRQQSGPSVQFQEHNKA